MTAMSRGRIPSGTGVDEFEFYVDVEGCGAFYSVGRVYAQPGESSNDHDNFVPLNSYGYWEVDRDCTFTLQLEVKNTGDDAYDIYARRLGVKRY